MKVMTVMGEILLDIESKVHEMILKYCNKGLIIACIYSIIFWYGIQILI